MTENPAEITELSRATPVALRAGVVVAGGGPAGIAAAIASARAGARTLLVERYGFPGGAGTAAGVTNFCGLYAVRGGQPFRVVRGIASDITEALTRIGAAVDPQPAMGGRTFVAPYDAHTFKRVADELLLGAGATLRFHTLAVGAVVESGRIRALLTESKSGRQAIEGTVFVDATGDADLAVFAGAPVEKSSALQSPTLMFRLGGVDDDAAEREGIPRLRELMAEAERAGGYQFPRLDAILRPQPFAGEWRANMTRITRPGGTVDGTDADDLTFAEIEGRRQVELYARFLRERVPGFARSRVIEIAPQVGIRETRRIAGRYVLTGDDVLRAADFADAIGCNPWPAERHTAGKEIEFRWIGGRGYHQIPYRCLLPLGVDNLLVAGRCVSATSDAQSSVRVSGPCFATGQAAGLAAALCAQRGYAPADLDVALLQRRLLDGGAFLGDPVP